MDKKRHVFIKKNASGKMTKTNHKMAEQVRIPINDYNTLVKNFDTTTSPDKIIISLPEYNGLQKALKICRDRALQQIDKAKADEHGYCLKNMKRKIYNPEVNKWAWQISVITPHSSRLGYEEVAALIYADLRDFYNYVGLPSIPDENGKPRQLSVKQFLKCVEDLANPDWNYDFLLSNCEFGRNAMKHFAKINTKSAIFEITEISVNYGLGRYEVSYWTTDLVQDKQIE